MKSLTNNKHAWIIPLYAIFYIGSFIFLERRVTEPNIT
jgi:hypothetical protein